MVLRGAGEKAFVAGTDIRQFADFDESGDDALAYEATIDRIVGRLEAVRKPTVALVDGFAMGSGLALSATCDLRVCTPAARFGLPIARTVGNCLSMDELRAARRAARPGAAEGHRLHRPHDRGRRGAGDRARHRGRRAGRAEARVEELCELLASHAPVTLWATKEALRRIRAATTPDGEDLVRAAYGSEGFRANVARFLEAEGMRAAWSNRARHGGARTTDFAVAARTRIEARNRERERKAARRDRRGRILLWLLRPAPPARRRRRRGRPR